MGAASVRVEFLFDFGSPNAYLAHRVIPALEARSGARVVYAPILLGGVFKLTGNASPAVTLRGIRNKPEYEALEMRRFTERHGIRDFRPNPHFPVNTLAPMRGALVARCEGVFERYVDAMFRAMWSEPRKLDDPEVFASALAEAGLDAGRILAGIGDPGVKIELRERTEAAVARGVFGAPSFFVGDELFFGKDRLDDVEREIARQAG